MATYRDPKDRGAGCPSACGWRRRPHRRQTTEATNLADHGLGPILVHYPPIGPHKWNRLAELARTTALTVVLDSIESAPGLDEALGVHGSSVEVLIEVEVGYGRTGVRGVNSCVVLGKQITSLRNVELSGISIYPGHARLGTDVEVRECLVPVRDTTEEVLARFDREDLRRDRVSGGTSPSLFLSHTLPVTEIRPGTYLLVDRSEISYGVYTVDECAARVVATVVSAHEDVAVIDAGSKTLSEAGYHGFGAASGYGLVVDHPNVSITKLDEEHGICRVSSGPQLGVGDRISIIPNHICATMNLHDIAYGQRFGVVETVFDISGRGKIR